MLRRGNSVVKGRIMAPRAISSGTITFGLVSVPVKLFSGTQSKKVSFNMLHEPHKARLRQQYRCSACNEVVERKDSVKGFELSKGQYVVLTNEEIKALDVKSDQSIEIEEFVPIDSVDPLYFDKSYLLAPDKGGGKAYHLLIAAMKKSGRGALARYSTRGRQQLVLLREAVDGLVMHTLYYADEVRDFSEIDRGPEASAKEGELDLAVQLLDQLASEEFRPERYEDEYRKRALDLIEQKAAGQEVVSVPGEAPKGQIIDLMEALKASLAEASPPVASEKRKPPRRRSGAAEKGKKEMTAVGEK